MSASRSRSVIDAEFPVNGSPRQKLGFALNYAALAPAESNWQTWGFRLEDTHLELMAKDDSRPNDSDGREVIIGCGAALLYLKLALKHFGCLGRVALFPDLGEPKLVARVHFGFCSERNTQERLLFEAMNRGRAFVTPLAETPFSETMLAALSQSAAGERGWLDFVQSEVSRQRVMDVALARDSLWMNLDPSFAGQMDLASPRYALDWLPPLFAFEGRRMDSRLESVVPIRQPSVPGGTLAVVKTKTDEKHGWLAAGQTMARTVLQAQALGLSWAFLNPVRRREARAALRMPVGHKGFAQVILCFGPLTAGETVMLSAHKASTEAFK